MAALSQPSQPANTIPSQVLRAGWTPSPIWPDSVVAFKTFVEDLRQIRDERHYAPGHHCFRAWVMHTYGEKLGGWLDDIL